MDTLASLALATEPPHEKLLLRQPHNRDDYIVDKVITFNNRSENGQTYYRINHLSTYYNDYCDFRR